MLGVFCLAALPYNIYLKVAVILMTLYRLDGRNVSWHEWEWDAAAALMKSTGWCKQVGKLIPKNKILPKLIKIKCTYLYFTGSYVSKKRFGI